MGYTTHFEGKFDLNKKLDEELYNFLNKLSETRRMARRVDESIYGIEGEFYVEGEGFAGQEHEDNIINFNLPPSSQPSLWLDWKPSEDGTSIAWNGSEKTYYSKEWIEYLIEKILKKKGYILNGTVHAVGEDGYSYLIIVEDNVVRKQLLPPIKADY